NPQRGLSLANEALKFLHLESFVLATLNDHAVSALVATRLLALGLQTPRAHRMRVALAGLAFAATVRMVDRVHHDAADGGAHAEPTDRSGLAEHPQVVLVVSDLADGGAAVDMNLAHFAGFQTHAGIHALARRELRGPAGTARQLAALTDLEFDVVDRAAHRDVAQRKRVARLDRRIGARTEFVAGLDALGRQDVAA